MSTWSTNSLRENNVEIACSDLPSVRYVLEAVPSRLTVQAFVADHVVETVSLTRAVHEFVFEATDREGRRTFLALSLSREPPMTRVVQADEEYLVEGGGSASEHVRLLASELKKRVRPDGQLVKRLGEELQSNGELRDRVKTMTEFGPRVFVAESIPNAANAACAAACFLCALTSFPGCVACAICIEIKSLR